MNFFVFIILFPLLIPKLLFYINFLKKSNKLSLLSPKIQAPLKMLLIFLYFLHFNQIPALSF